MYGRAEKLISDFATLNITRSDGMILQDSAAIGKSIMFHVCYIGFKFVPRLTRVGSLTKNEAWLRALSDFREGKWLQSRARRIRTE